MKRIPKKNIEDTSLTMNCLSVMEDVEILEEMSFPYRRNKLFDVLENGLKCFMVRNNFELCFGAVYLYVEALERLMQNGISERISLASHERISAKECINTFMNDIYEWSEWFYRYNVRKETSSPVAASEDVSEVAPVDNVSSTDKGDDSQIIPLRDFFLIKGDLNGCDVFIKRIQNKFKAQQIFNAYCGMIDEGLAKDLKRGDKINLCHALRAERLINVDDESFAKLSRPKRKRV